MIAFTFIFPNNPTGEDGSIRASVIAQSEEEAWIILARQFQLPLERLKSYSPTIQMKRLKAGEIIISQPGKITDSDNPWINIVSEGIKDITTVIKDTAGAAQKDKAQIELAKLGIDKIVILVFSTAFLSALLFSFYLIVVKDHEALFKFIFPIITGVIGLISGYFAGRGAGSSSQK